MGRFLDEGMTEWLARAEFGPNAELSYEANVTFTELLAERVGADTLRNAYLHGQWAPLRRALVHLLGSEEQVQHWYGLVRGLGPEDSGGAALDEAARMLIAGSM
jgi:squalene cyclase